MEMGVLMLESNNIKGGFTAMVHESERFKKGSLPPSIGLADAITLVGKIYEHAGGKANYDLLSRIFDNSQSSSSFVRKLAALRTYGVVAEPTKGDVVLSDTGLAIAAPISDDTSGLAKKDAFLRIDVYNKLHARHKGKLLPADEFLRNIIEQDCGIPRELSARWAKEFKDGARTAGLLYDRGDGKLQLMDSPVASRISDTSQTLVESAGGTATREQSRATEGRPTLNMPIGASGHNTRIELSSGRFAVFSIPDTLTIRDAKKLKSAISGLTSIIDSMVQEEDPESRRGVG
jgi:hypothetical protein